MLHICVHVVWVYIIKDRIHINIIDIHVNVCACCLSVPFTSINGIIHFLYYTGLSFLQMIVTAKFNGNTPLIAQVEVDMYDRHTHAQKHSKQAGPYGCIHTCEFQYSCYFCPCLLMPATVETGQGESTPWRPAGLWCLLSLYDFRSAVSWRWSKPELPRAVPVLILWLTSLAGLWPVICCLCWYCCSAPSLNANRG